jgi:hypothetical protein
MNHDTDCKKNFILNYVQLIMGIPTLLGWYFHNLKKNIMAIFLNGSDGSSKGVIRYSQKMALSLGFYNLSLLGWMGIA